MRSDDGRALSYGCTGRVGPTLDHGHAADRPAGRDERAFSRGMSSGPAASSSVASALHAASCTCWLWSSTRASRPCATGGSPLTLHRAYAVPAITAI